jgi:serine O-acetyltransferase
MKLCGTPVIDDFRRIAAAGRVSAPRLAYYYASHPGFRAVLLFRIAHALHAGGWPRAARFVANHSLASTGCDIRPEADIGPGLLLHHPAGIVIGGGARIARNCTILQGVTVGEKYSAAADHSYPQIGDGVTLCAGAVLLGAICVGSGSVIGANAVVLQDVPAGAVAVGAPARILR